MKFLKRLVLASFVLAGLAVVGVLASRRWSEATVVRAAEPAPEQAVVVATVEARRRTIREWVFAEGIVRSARREYLTFKHIGRVAWVKPGADGGILREGELVAADELLAYQDKRHAEAEVNSAAAAVDEVERSIRVARAEHAQAEADAKLARVTATRYERLHAAKSVSQQELDEHRARAETARFAVARAAERIEAATASHAAALERLAQARLGIEDTELRSPIAGMLAYVNVRVGHLFMPSIVRTDSETAALRTVPLVVMDPDEMEVTVEVPAYERGRVRRGQRVYLDTGGDEGRSGDPADLPLQGTVVSVNPAIDPSGRTFQVRIEVGPVVRGLADGMFVSAWIAVAEREGISVPSNVVHGDGAERYVYAVDPGTQRAVRREIQLGIADLDRFEVLGGLAEGEPVVSKGARLVGDGTLLRVLRAPEVAADGAR